jgi:hypothetical protein
MSKLGFDKLIRNLPNIKRRFLVNGIRLAQNEMRENFEGEKNSESGTDWKDVKRPTPPKILIETNSMYEETQNNRPAISGNTAVLTIDPMDSRGRNYAAYHQEKPSQGNNVQREFVTQSADLDKRQLDELCRQVEKYL